MAVEWHVSASYPLYSPEARGKWFMYPGPYNGSYATPWLWVDGRQRGYNYNLWPSFVAARISEPTPVLITLSGNYNQSTRSGTIKALIQNDSSADLTMRVSVVITEDSIYYAAPNGDPWHNHVCRDYIPNQYGTVITVPAGGIDSVVQPFSIASTWNEQRCNIVVYAQSTTMVPADSSYPAYQAAQVKVLDLVGVGEQRSPSGRTHHPAVTVSTIFGRPILTIATGTPVAYRLSIHTVEGRTVHTQRGTATGTGPLLVNKHLTPGVYFYRLQIGDTGMNGKLVVSN